jgi:hypothetical protein
MPEKIHDKEGELIFHKSLAREHQRAGQAPDKHEVPDAEAEPICTQV